MTKSPTPILMGHYLLLGEGAGVFEVDNLSISRPVCDTYFTPRLKQNIYFNFLEFLFVF